MSNPHISIRVVNQALDRHCVEGGSRVYVGRPSVLGNPFVIAKYTTWLDRRIRLNDRAVISELERIKSIAIRQPVELACHCMPASCHAERVSEIVRRMIDQDQAASLKQSSQVDPCNA